MLDEGGGGDVGVHADHHVLSLNSLLLRLQSPQQHGSSPCTLQPTTTTHKAERTTPASPTTFSHSVVCVSFPPSLLESLLVPQSSL